MRYANRDLVELYRMKEIVEWQLSFAKCYKIVAERKQQLKDINEAIENKTTIKSKQ